MSLLAVDEVSLLLGLFDQVVGGSVVLGQAPRCRTRKNFRLHSLVPASLLVHGFRVHNKLIGLLKQTDKTSIIEVDVR